MVVVDGFYLLEGRVDEQFVVESDLVIGAAVLETNYFLRHSFVSF